jgi:hypothetical protein
LRSQILYYPVYMKYYNIMFKRFFPIWVVLMASCSLMNAQQSDNTPYSRFGIGELADNHMNHLRQMGGLGSAVIDVYQFNVLNPASYSYLNAFALDVGLFAKHNTLRDEKNKSNIWTGNIDYLAMGFPLRNPINDVYEGKKSNTKMGMSFALMPHSNVSYNILSASNDSILGALERTYVGSGGSYKFLFGNAIKYKDIAFGLNLGYLFGKIDYQRNIDYVELPYAYQNRFSTNYNLSGFIWNAGAMYSKVLNKKITDKDKTKQVKMLTVGIRGNSINSFHTNSNKFDYTIQTLPTQINRDTISQEGDIKGKGSLPAELGIGAHYYYGEKWSLGFDYQYSVWDGYFNDATSDKKGSMLNSNRFAIGGYFRPNYKSFDNFFERVYYRYGAFYNTDPRSIQGEQISGYGISFGLGMPFIYQRKVSFVNLGVQYGQRAASLPISEKYVKISLGVTFNDDEWFLKSKYY